VEGPVVGILSPRVGKRGTIATAGALGMTDADHFESLTPGMDRRAYSQENQL